MPFQSPRVAAAAVTLLGSCATVLRAQAVDPLASWQQRQTLDRESPHRALAWQPVGPRFCGGRIESIAVPAQRPYRLYVAPGSGNLFRSDDGGLVWQPIFEHEATHAIGCVAVAPSDPDVVWVGTGEAHLGGMSWDGVGVYRSTDGGASWRHVGLGM
ncbi:MAG: glycosyl hydrolase, partial [Planctomycetes bacterium]|nr:glycosyl hydrolase [Planctomycetota bacterium]